MGTLFWTSCTLFDCGDYAATNALLDELIALADEKGSSYWKAFEMVIRGWVLAMTGKASEAVRMITSGVTALRSTGTTVAMTISLSHLATAYAQLGQFRATASAHSKYASAFERSRRLRD